MQMVLPENHRQDPEFISNLQTLQNHGFFGVELNIAHAGKANISDITAFLDQFNLKMTMFASGLTAKTLGLSLSSPDPAARRRAVDHCRHFIQQLSGFDMGLIIGFLKGPPSQNPGQAKADFAASLEQISPMAERYQVPVLIEATNRYESSVANTLEDAMRLIAPLKNPCFQILPDTFHMHIEEIDSGAALFRFSDLYHSVHISDNTRFFPGLGAIDFREVFNTLKKIGFKGQLAIEGNIRDSFQKDIEISMAYLEPILKA